jgi:hypothetical protein
MSQSRWIHARHSAAALALVLAVVPASAGAALPVISFTPAAPSSSDVATADLPFLICAWTIVATPAHIDINYLLAPCAQQGFTDKISLGQLAPGTYTVTLSVLQQGSPIPQAVGILGVTGAVTPTPAVGPVGLLLCMLGLSAFAGIALRTRGSPARR